MDVITRNLFRLLRAGAFNEQEQLEPLAAWKWKQLYLTALQQGIDDYIEKGFERLRGQFFLQLPDDLRQGTQKTGKTTEKPAQLTNPKLKKEMKLIEEEAENDNLQHTLRLLHMLTHISTATLSEGIPLRMIVETGLLLRSEGDKMDYTKLEEWCERLHMERMNQLIGQLLISLCHFSPDELPFLTQKDLKKMDVSIEQILQESGEVPEDWTFEQGNDIFVRSNSSAMLKSMKHSARYFRYYPWESISNFASSFLRSLQNIEE